ncbi:heavy metal-binding domain-containing protein [Legionella fallonii]|uniref:Uncharacterized protein n=1 Tax=Legionella fallonii LLAP-10 TaxID=1212491 RepID=A0A098G8T8_9GAMM|nr:heavy metal-binding domain-containing protein [Legionella fallonii]CEG58381.1 conserved protein of unknown function [Legionella fallonii LLAP-10]
MSLLDFMKSPNSETMALRALNSERQAEISEAIKKDRVPKNVCERLTASREGGAPWIATLSSAELSIIRSHGIRPIAAVSATCWMHYGWSWSKGHSQGWNIALKRLCDEAKAAGANAVIDVKMRTIPLQIENSMDFSLIGTAVKIDGLPPSSEPVIATVSALEFVKLLEADIVPTGIAVGAAFEWMEDWRGSTNLFWMGNIECSALTALWERVRRMAYDNLRKNAKLQGNGALAHINFSQMSEREVENRPKQYLARTIAIATTVDTSHVKKIIPHDFQMVVDLHAGKTPLVCEPLEHQSYISTSTSIDQEGPILYMRWVGRLRLIMHAIWELLIKK